MVNHTIILLEINNPQNFPPAAGKIYKNEYIRKLKSGIHWFVRRQNSYVYIYSPKIYKTKILSYLQCNLKKNPPVRAAKILGTKSLGICRKPSKNILCVHVQYFCSEVHNVETTKWTLAGVRDATPGFGLSPRVKFVYWSDRAQNWSTPTSRVNKGTINGAN